MSGEVAAHVVEHWKVLISFYKHHLAGSSHTSGGYATSIRDEDENGGLQRHSVVACGYCSST